MCECEKSGKTIANIIFDIIGAFTRSTTETVEELGYIRGKETQIILQETKELRHEKEKEIQNLSQQVKELKEKIREESLKNIKEEMRTKLK